MDAESQEVIIINFRLLNDFSQDITEIGDVKVKDCL